MSLLTASRRARLGLYAAAFLAPAVATAAPLCGTAGNLVGNGVSAASVTTRLVETATAGEYQLQVELTAAGAHQFIESQVGGGLSPGSQPASISQLFGALASPKKTYRTYYSQNVDGRATHSEHLLPGTYSVDDTVLIAVHATVRNTQRKKNFSAWVPGQPIPAARDGGMYLSCRIPALEVKDDRYLLTKIPLSRKVGYDIEADLGVLSNDMYGDGSTVELEEDFTWSDVKWGAALNNQPVDPQYALLDFDADDGSFQLEYDRRPASDQMNFVGPNLSADFSTVWGEFRFKYRVTDGFGRSQVATAFVQVNESNYFFVDLGLRQLIDISPPGTLSDNATFSIALNSVPYIVPEPTITLAGGVIPVTFIFNNYYASNEPNVMTVPITVLNFQDVVGNNPVVEIQGAISFNELKISVVDGNSLIPAPHPYAYIRVPRGPTVESLDTTAVTPLLDSFYDLGLP